MVFGEFIKTSPAGSTRPIDVFPYVWSGLSKAQRLDRIKGFPERQRLRYLETARRLVGPAMAIQENKHYVPSMPTTNDPQEHRQKIDVGIFPFNAAVARTVTKKEVQSNPEALKAVIIEWEKLRKAGCWDESDVRVWDDVAEAARAAGTTHMWAESLRSAWKRVPS